MSETHWTQAGQRLDSEERCCCALVTKKKNAQHTRGAALMLFKEAHKALIGWKSHGLRIIKAPLKKKKEEITMNVIQFCAINDSNGDKYEFCGKLQSIIAKYPGKDPTILMGDLDAKVGMDNTGYEDNMGWHGLEERNENGE